MGILSRIKEGLKWVVSAPFIALDNILSSLADAGEKLRGGVDEVLGFKEKRKHHPPKEEIRSALRQQYLDLLPGETEVAGVEWEGEIYYETPK